ncbi:nuclear transport factor 2 family protein [Xanthobacter sp. KR7-65]|uniref:nuclear transport factor 2 family protein n=1 Tax=Xanthobacter sp. KR7-65 TaxID=3156612 RepID=UPI0032B3CD52
MSPEDVRSFAVRLMDEVWRPFDHTALARFYHPDVVGHHRAQTLALEDIANRLQWDVQNFGDPVYDIQDIVADEDKFAIRFLYSCTLLATAESFHVEVIYFYHLRDGLISAFWLLSSTDFDYKQHPA